jgi:hypothetical protein
MVKSKEIIPQILHSAFIQINKLHIQKTGFNKRRHIFTMALNIFSYYSINCAVCVYDLLAQSIFSGVQNPVSFCEWLKHSLATPRPAEAIYICR